jgi:O-antigen/teichoic acid export membrane protein
VHVDSGLPSGMRWSTVSVIAREGSRSLFTIIIARLVGPEDFGIVAQAMVYIGIVGLLVDQGFSSALIQRKHVRPEMPGVVVSVNVGVGALLTLSTIAIAPLWASFMHTPQLLLVLIALSPILVIRSIGITARAMLMRDMDFRTIGIADTASTIVGGVLGVAVALAGGGYWSVVVQTLVSDVVYQVTQASLGARWRPNLQFRLLREIAGFSARAFAAGVLINSVSRNIDNLLIGRFQGPQALAFYGLAYRLLLLPVQLASTTVGAVLFPAFAKVAHDKAALAAQMSRATRALATLSLPVMALLATATPQLVPVIFGSHWSPAIPITQVLAIAGALQAIYQPSTGPLILGLGHAKLNLRYAWLTTIVAAVGIVAGLPFGPFGVAVGYATATALLLPVEWLLRRHLLGLSLRGQIATLAPGAHIAIWMSGAYFAVATTIHGADVVRLALGTVAAVCCGAVVLRMAHHRLLAELVFMARRVMGRGSDAQAPSDPGSPDSEIGADTQIDRCETRKDGPIP